MQCSLLKFVDGSCVAWSLGQESFLTAESAENMKESGLARSVHQADIVVCHCKFQSICWLADLIPDDAAVQTLLYSTCAQTTSLEPPEVLPASTLKQRCRNAPEETFQADADCPTELVLKHLLAHASDAEFLLFLPSLLPDDYEQHLSRLVFKSLSQRTFRAEFLALGHTRLSPKVLNACQKQVLESLDISSHASGYGASRFIVSARRLAKSLDRVHAVLSALASSPRCVGYAWEVVMEGLWHTLFGEVALLPIRADDQQIPTVLRVLDGPSGFANTKMPKSSEYLSWAAMGLTEP